MNDLEIADFIEWVNLHMDLAWLYIGLYIERFFLKIKFYVRCYGELAYLFLYLYFIRARRFKLRVIMWIHEKYHLY